MKDSFDREIHYLRLAVTERCDLHCPYCGGGAERTEALSDEMLEAIVTEAVQLGVDKLRLTGGEPLCRPGLPELCRRLASVPGIREVALTTNGTHLAQQAQALKEAGLSRVNVSLDSLRPERYHRLTGGSLDQVFSGIQSAWAVGLRPLKLNVVLMKNVNEDEIADFLTLAERYPIEVRFIELMPLGQAARLGAEAYLSCAAVEALLPPQAMERFDGVARICTPDGWRGRVGLIRPMSRAFCSDCNRLRVTADGRLKPCLHTSTEIDVRKLSGAELRQALLRAIAGKPPCRPELEPGRESPAGRSMGRIGG